MAAKYPQKSLKTLKKGETFTLCGFTGMKLGTYTVTAASKSQFKAVKADGSEMIFNRKDGKQANANNPQYANYAVDTQPEDKKAPAKGKAAKKPAKAKKAAKPAPVEEDDDEEGYLEDECDEDDFEEEPAPVKKPAKAKKPAAKKPAAKKAAKKPATVEPDDDDDFDDDEDWEDM